MSGTVRDNAALSRFELEADGMMAIANYRLADGIITFTHTEVPPQARGHGLAAELIAGALEAVRARGLKVVARCSYVRAYLARHPQFRDLLA
ncbi:MAG TPA: GNAT family N-acetyltransferase [Xanthobacteraceae bacterium]|nr:GNAT family N-acetyltransferase [Xanthobacteraceae bacterium]